MTLIDAALKDTLSPEMRTQAAAWLARLHGPNRTPQAESGFRRWLQADPRHGAAFELVTEVWDKAGGVRRPLPRTIGRTSLRWLPAASAVAATVLLSVLGTLLYMRDGAVETAIGEQRNLTLEDGSRIFLNTATRVEVQYDERARRIRLQQGEALFEVAPRSGRPFIVAAGDREVVALGTAFVVRKDPGRLAVTLVEGKVKVVPSDARPVGDPVMIPGQRLIFSAGTAPRMDLPAIDKVIAWRQGQVVLDDAPLAEAIAEMNRYSTVALSIERPEAAHIRISGVFRAGDSGNFAKAVAATYRLTVIEGPRQLILAGAPQPASEEAPARPR